MDKGGQFCEDCGGAKDHFHLSQRDVDEMKSISEYSRMQGQMTEHMRTAPVNTNKHAELHAHLMSAGHWEEPPHGMSLSELQAMHDEHHAEMDSGPEDERENHTTIGNSHFHH